MLGVIIAYPGTPVDRFKEVHPGIHFSEDGFGIGQLPTIDHNRKILTYSNKTMVLVDNPESTLWRVYQQYFTQLDQATFLTSVVNGAQRLNFFFATWLKVAEAKPIAFAHVADAGRFTTKFKRVFGVDIKGEIKPLTLMRPGWNDYALNIISAMCPAWDGVKEALNG